MDRSIERCAAVIDRGSDHDFLNFLFKAHEVMQPAKGGEVGGGQPIAPNLAEAQGGGVVEAPEGQCLRNDRVIDRRSFVTGLGLILAVPLAAEAQQAAKVWRVGILCSIICASPDVDAFREKLSTLGY